MVYHAGDDLVQWRKVRKGTRSCADCRRRKVKCIFVTSESTTCVVCLRRGVQCTSQAAGMPDSIEALNGRDLSGRDNAQAVALLRQGLYSTPQLFNETSLTPATDPQALPSPPQGIRFATPPSAGVPVATGRGTKIQDKHTYRPTEDVPASILPAHAAVRDALLSAVPCQRDIAILSEKFGLILAHCYQADYKAHASPIEQASQHATSARSLLQPEEHPTLLARQMLLLAGAIQFTSPKEVVPGLTQHQHVIMKGLAESAIKLVNLDDSLLDSLEGMENLIFEIFYHVDCGNIRRAWITTRRAITAAQMLGLHPSGHYRFLLIDPDSDLDPEMIWATIVSVERLLSLLLGLPTSTAYSDVPLQLDGPSHVSHDLTSLVGRIAGKILECNSIDSAEKAMRTTREIDREIIITAEQMPSTFWRPLEFTGLYGEPLSALAETRRAFGQMCYYSMIVQLHLPHMLSPHNALQRVHSKIACVNASREILTREIQLRTFDPVSACCRMSDFIAIIAGMALMLGHATSHGANERIHMLAQQRLGDRAIVIRILDCIDPMSDLHGDELVVRCAAILHDLLTIEEAAAQQHSNQTNQQQDGANGAGKSEQHILITRAPHLGSIRISSEGITALPTTKIDHARNTGQGVTIGGIGSMAPGGRATSDGTHGHQGNAAMANTPSPLGTVNIGLNRQSTQLHNPVTTSQASPSSMMQIDGSPPFPAASFDDWTFQGVDTAFMDSLLRGSAMRMTDGCATGGWDMNTLL